MSKYKIRLAAVKGGNMTPLLGQIQVLQAQANRDFDDLMSRTAEPTSRLLKLSASCASLLYSAISERDSLSLDGLVVSIVKEVELHTAGILPENLTPILVEGIIQVCRKTMKKNSTVEKKELQSSLDSYFYEDIVTPYRDILNERVECAPFLRQIFSPLVEEYFPVVSRETGRLRRLLNRSFDFLLTNPSAFETFGKNLSNSNETPLTELVGLYFAYFEHFNHEEAFALILQRQLYRYRMFSRDISFSENPRNSHPVHIGHLNKWVTVEYFQNLVDHTEKTISKSEELGIRLAAYQPQRLLYSKEVVNDPKEYCWLKVFYHESNQEDCTMPFDDGIYNSMIHDDSPYFKRNISKKHASKSEVTVTPFQRFLNSFEADMVALFNASCLFQGLSIPNDLFRSKTIEWVLLKYENRYFRMNFLDCLYPLVK